MKMTNYYNASVSCSKFLERPSVLFFLGNTKTGKTTFCREFVQAFVDEKFKVIEEEDGKEVLSGYTVFAYDPNAFFREFYVGGVGRMKAKRYKPGYIENGPPFLWGRTTDTERALVEMADMAERGKKLRVLLVIDELLHLPKAKIYERIKVICSNRRHDELWACFCSQEAAHIPSHALWLANSIYCFRLQSPRDLKEFQPRTTGDIENFPQGKYEEIVLNDP